MNRRIALSEDQIKTFLKYFDDGYSVPYSLKQANVTYTQHREIQRHPLIKPKIDAYKKRMSGKRHFNYDGVPLNDEQKSILNNYKWYRRNVRKNELEQKLKLELDNKKFLEINIEEIPQDERLPRGINAR